MTKGADLSDATPTVVLVHGAFADAAGPYSQGTIEGGVGHNLPQEAPEAFADAVLEVGATR